MVWKETFCHFAADELEPSLGKFAELYSQLNDEFAILIFVFLKVNQLALGRVVKMSASLVSTGGRRVGSGMLTQ